MTNKNKSILYDYAIYSGISLQLVITVVIGMVLGRYFDNYWGTKPWLLVTGVILGMLGGFYNVFILVKAYQKRKS